MAALTTEQEYQRWAAIVANQVVRRGAITEIKTYGEDGKTIVSFTMDGWGFGAPLPEGAEMPKAGDQVVVYGEIGRPIWGVDINGAPFFFKTTAEREQERQDMLAKMDVDRRERFEANKTQMDTDYDGLPEVLRRRVDRFRAGNPNFREEFEGYEVAGLKGAVAAWRRCMKDAFGDELKAEGVKVPTADEREKPTYEWSEGSGTLDWENTPENRWLALISLSTKINDYNHRLEERLVPELAEADSGNLHGFALRMAKWLVEGNEEALVYSHGAMVPLVGCVKYGCTHEPAPAGVSQ